MTTVQSWNGKDVHHGESDGEESRHAPEQAPNPRVREYFADRDETTHAFVCLVLRIHNQFDLLPIVRESLKGFGKASWDCLEESVVLNRQVKRLDRSTNDRLIAKMHVKNNSIICSESQQFEILVLILHNCISEIMEIRGFNVVNTDNLVTFSQSCQICRANLHFPINFNAIYDTVDYERQTGRNKT